RVIDAHRVHPAVAELHVAQNAAGLGLLGGAHRIARHAAAHVLVADLRGRDAGAVLRPARDDELLEDLVLHVGQELAVVPVLVMVGVDVDDHHVVEFALHRLLAGVAQELRRVELVNRYAPAAIYNEVHVVSPWAFKSMQWTGAFSGPSSSAT